MQKAVPLGKGGMLAILGVDKDKIEKYLQEIRNHGICEIANDNADGQIIVSGNIECIKLLQNNFKKDKIKSILLNVSAPFHCSLMKSAVENMRKINSVNFKKPKFDIICNVIRYGITLIILKIIGRTDLSSVRWRES